MKVLLDTCIWPGMIEELAKAGHDVTWAGNWPSDPGDEQILEIAYNEERVLITLDKDFGELAILQGKSHRGIIRIVNFSVRAQGQISLFILKKYHDQLQNRAIITVDPNKVRIREEGA
ncbi:MAG: DUF5615 family PIN-like protein [Calditrichaeota bacterium]|nr:DUF5615 family PIN-like protein [Calditrichota bacterium]MCB0304851.1 DUF5615 family PIN-like protein [Calditrichota bacterium]MCB0314505.1 DUF5615 family PIN-like protein [Calditrichota bacterium]